MSDLRSNRLLPFKLMFKYTLRFVQSQSHIFPLYNYEKLLPRKRRNLFTGSFHLSKTITICKLSPHFRLRLYYSLLSGTSFGCFGYSTGQYGLHALPFLSTRTPGQSLHLGRLGHWKSAYLGVHFLGHTEQLGLHGSGLFCCAVSTGACSLTLTTLFLSALIRLIRIKLITANSITIIKITNIISIVSIGIYLSGFLLYVIPSTIFGDDSTCQNAILISFFWQMSLDDLPIQISYLPVSIQKFPWFSS